MQKPRNNGHKNIEKTINDILRSKARSRIYTYLLKNNGAKTDQIVRGTKLHPSTVRETLAKMYRQKLIYRKKIKNDAIGKNPYMYYSISPIELLKRYTDEIEERLNRLASLAFRDSDSENYKPIKIKIHNGVDRR